MLRGEFGGWVQYNWKISSACAGACAGRGASICVRYTVVDAVLHTTGTVPQGSTGAGQHQRRTASLHPHAGPLKHQDAVEGGHCGGRSLCCPLANPHLTQHHMPHMRVRLRAAYPGTRRVDPPRPALSLSLSFARAPDHSQSDGEHPHPPVRDRPVRPAVACQLGKPFEQQASGMMDRGAPLGARPLGHPAL